MNNFILFQALGKALSKIRAEMVEQAEETLKAHQEEKKQELNMQKLVEKHTEELKVSVTKEITRFDEILFKNLYNVIL